MCPTFAARNKTTIEVKLAVPVTLAMSDASCSTFTAVVDGQEEYTTALPSTLL